VLARHPHAGTRQPDPSEQEGLFSYLYAGDNPSDLGDPSGLLAAPPQTGCLLTSNGNLEINVAVDSDQWNVEVGQRHGTTDARMAIKPSSPWAPCSSPATSFPGLVRVFKPAAR
jgi:hypothetical protein